MCRRASPIGIGSPGALPGPIQTADLQLVVEAAAGAVAPARPRSPACAAPSAAGTARRTRAPTRRGRDRRPARICSSGSSGLSGRTAGRRWWRGGCRRRSPCSCRSRPAGASRNPPRGAASAPAVAASPRAARRRAAPKRPRATPAAAPPPSASSAFERRARTGLGRPLRLAREQPARPPAPTGRGSSRRSPRPRAARPPGRGEHAERQVLDRELGMAVRALDPAPARRIVRSVQRRGADAGAHDRPGPKRGRAAEAVTCRAGSAACAATDRQRRPAERFTPPRSAPVARAARPSPRRSGR